MAWYRYSGTSKSTGHRAPRVLSGNFLVLSGNSLVLSGNYVNISGKFLSGEFLNPVLKLTNYLFK